MSQSIPVLDLSDFTSGSQDQRKQFVQDLGRAYEDIGFVAIKQHGLNDELQKRLYGSVQAFFHLPSDSKLKYDGQSIAGQRGYTAPLREKAKDATTPDLKEFYHVGQELPDSNPLRQQASYPANIWPEEVPDFQHATLEAFTALEEAGRQMLRAIALFLELDENYFDAKIEHGNSILRPLHYFPIENPDALPPEAVRAAAHEDINLITLLMGASAEGLEVLRHDGSWLAVTAIPEAVVVNVGDMLQRLTNNRLRSTTHRVVNPPREKMGTSRFSIPFFLHPRSEVSLACLPSCVDASHPKAYPDATAGEYLTERLRELGLLV